MGSSLKLEAKGPWSALVGPLEGAMSFLNPQEGDLKNHSPASGLVLQSLAQGPLATFLIAQIRELLETYHPSLQSLLGVYNQGL